MCTFDASRPRVQARCAVQHAFSTKLAVFKWACQTLSCGRRAWYLDFDAFLLIRTMAILLQDPVAITPALPCSASTLRNRLKPGVLSLLMTVLWSQPPASASAVSASILSGPFDGPVALIGLRAAACLCLRKSAGTETWDVGNRKKAGWAGPHKEIDRPGCCFHCVLSTQTQESLNTGNSISLDGVARTTEAGTTTCMNR